MLSVTPHHTRKEEVKKEKKEHSHTAWNFKALMLAEDEAEGKIERREEKKNCNQCLAREQERWALIIRA